ncbi:MAG: arginine repressor [Actinomycetota bacterium]
MAANVKARRRRRIVQILQRHAVESQADLVALLRDQGEQVTQATLSRDLDDLGAFKARGPDGRLTYRLPDEPPATGETLRKMLTEFVTDVESSGSMVVLRTPPGCAHPVARAMDAAGVKDVIATVAGDDTVLVVCREGVPGRVIARRVESILTETRTSKGA